MTGDHDHLRVDLPLAETLQRLEPVDARHPDVEQHHVEGLLDHPLETGLARRHGLDRVALVAQHAAQRGAHARLVVDDQNRCHTLTQQGSSIVKRVPVG